MMVAGEVQTLLRAGRDAELLGELGHEAEAGGVVLDGRLARTGPAREPAGAAQVDVGVVRFHALEVVNHAPNCFMRVFQASSRLQQFMRHDHRRWSATRVGVS